MDNEFIQKAQDELDYLNNDDEARALAEYYEDAKRNEYSALANATEKGRADGLVEGEKTAKTLIIKKMLSKNMDISYISELTDTPIEEILDIQKNNL